MARITEQWTAAQTDAELWRQYDLVRRYYHRRSQRIHRAAQKARSRNEQ